MSQEFKLILQIILLAAPAAAEAIRKMISGGQIPPEIVPEVEDLLPDVSATEQALEDRFGKGP